MSLLRTANIFGVLQVSRVPGLVLGGPFLIGCRVASLSFDDDQNEAQEMNLNNMFPSSVVKMIVAASICVSVLGCADEDDDQGQGQKQSSVSETAMPAEASNKIDHSGPKVEGNFPIEPDAMKIDWVQNPELPVLPKICSFVYPEGHTPFLAIGFLKAKFQSESWNFATGTKIGEITDVGETSTKRSLSPDGTAIAFWIRQSKSIEVWSYTTGQKVTTINLEKFAQFKLVSADRLLVSQLSKVDGANSYRLRLYDATNGNLLKERPPESDLNKVVFLSGLQVSGNSKFLAYFRSSEGFTVLQTDTLEPIAKIPVEVIPKSIGACAFSPDGTQLVGVVPSRPHTVIFLASLSDGQVQQFSIPGKLGGVTVGLDEPQGIEWLPDQSGWVVGERSIVDAKLRRQIWFMDFGMERFKRNIVLPSGLIHLARPKDPATGFTYPKFQRCDWPAQAVRKAAGELQAGKDVSLRPGDVVKVKVEIGTLKHGDAEHVKTTVKDTLEQRLVLGGMKISGADPAMELVAEYSEGPGQLMTSRGSRLSATAFPHDKAIRSSAATIKLSMQLPGTNKSLWSGDIVVDPATFGVRGKVTERSIRDAVFKFVPDGITDFPMPYFVSEDITLPGFTSKNGSSD